MKCPNCGNEMEPGTTICLCCGINPDVLKKRNERNKLLDNGKTKNKKRANKILALECIILIFITFVYIKVFVPQINDLLEVNNSISKRDKCIEEYDGVWDSKSDICHTEYSDIEIK